MKPYVFDVNHELGMVPEKVIPLVGLDQLPPGFKFRVNMYRLGVRCFAVISADCLVAWFNEFIGGVCERLMHQYIHDQLYSNQISLCSDADELGECFELFVKHDATFDHFDARLLVPVGA